MRCIDIFKFNILRGYFPNIKSLREFILSDTYLGNVQIIIESRDKNPTMETLFKACLDVLNKIGSEISDIRETYEGTTEFTDKMFHDVFRNKTRHVLLNDGNASGGEGISQNDQTVCPEWKINLSEEDWFVFKDNYGTTEEKAFVSYFASRIDELKKSYEQVYLVRNERQLVLYSFDGDERFEPDYLLFLQKRNSTGYEQYQIFVEPKGSYLLAGDKWKEDFLLEIERRGIPKKTFVDDKDYHVWGFPSYNRENRMKEFTDAFNNIPK